VVIQSLAEEFDVVDVAAAAVALLRAGPEAEREIEIPEPRRADWSVDGGARRRESRSTRTVSGGPDVVRIFIGAGREAGIRPADLVGAITGEAKIASRELGAIEIADRFSLVEVPRDRADDIVAAMKKATLRGQKVRVRLDREGA
jgi:ATP-dependent RNA helicase DeaD